MPDRLDEIERLLKLEDGNHKIWALLIEELRYLRKKIRELEKVKEVTG